MLTLPREIFDHIATFLGHFQKGNMTDAFGFLDENESNLLWRAIFKDEIWLNKAISYGAEPVLIGSHLNDVATAKREHQVYLVLHANDFSGDTCHAGLPFLLKSLRKHRYNERRHEVTLRKISWLDAANHKLTIPKIILNVRDIVKGAEELELQGKKIRKLFDKRNFTSKYSFYTSPDIKTLQSREIYGIGGAVSELGGLTPICVFNLQTPRKKWQIIFHEPGCPSVTPMFEGLRGVPHTIVGWQRTLI